ncbi:MAG: antiterminator LoaP [Lachnospiraceae bacterium]|jgi:transcriptional antiterminator NusG|nr:antiterminator LoaP [Lachnospiraceae bacterium]
MNNDEGRGLNKNWYVLFTKTGYEDRVLMQMKKCFTLEEVSPFIPKYEYYHKYANKKVQKEFKAMFPSYIFLESSCDNNEFYDLTRRFIRHFENPLKLLKYGKSSEMIMREQEKAFLMSLYNEEKCLLASVGFIIGDHIIITDGPLMGRESIIRKIDRSRKRATIEIEMMGRTIKVYVGLDILEKRTHRNLEILET